jgi:hypothetical protein
MQTRIREAIEAQSASGVLRSTREHRMELRLTQDDCGDIGFAVSSIFCSAIDVGELHQWCYKLIEDHAVDDLPQYIFSLVDFEGPLAQIFKVIGFVPGWSSVEDEDRALHGIAIKRGYKPVDWDITAEDALRALARNPSVEERFRQMFPFISF